MIDLTNVLSGLDAPGMRLTDDKLLVSFSKLAFREVVCKYYLRTYINEAVNEVKVYYPIITRKTQRNASIQLDLYVVRRTSSMVVTLVSQKYNRFLLSELPLFTSLSDIYTPTSIIGKGLTGDGLMEKLRIYITSMVLYKRIVRSRRQEGKASSASQQGVCDSPDCGGGFLLNRTIGCKIGTSFPVVTAINE